MHSTAIAHSNTHMQATVHNVNTQHGKQAQHSPLLPSVIWTPILLIFCLGRPVDGLWGAECPVRSRFPYTESTINNAIILWIGGHVWHIRVHTRPCQSGFAFRSYKTIVHKYNSLSLSQTCRYLDREHKLHSRTLCSQGT